MMLDDEFMMIFYHREEEIDANVQLSIKKENIKSQR